VDKKNKNKSNQNINKTSVYNPKNIRDYDTYDDYDEYDEDGYTVPKRQPVTPRGSGSSANRKKAPVKRTQTKRGRKQKSRGAYMAFYLLTLLAAVLICIGVFWAVFNMVTSGESSSGGSTQNPPTTQGSGQIVATNEIATTGLIISTNPRANSLEVLDIENEQVVTFTINQNTLMRSRTNEPLMFSDFNTGDIVDFRYPEAGSIVSSMTQSPRSWEQRNITGVRINLENDTIIWGNESYTFTENLKVIYNNQSVDISEIEANSVITMRGLGRTIWYIFVERGIGVLELVNAEEIQDGIIEFDGARPATLLSEDEEENRISLLEGSYRITVRGSNISTFAADIFIFSGQTTTLDLSSAEVVAGTLNISINVLDADVFINGERIRVSEPQVLSYGTYTITATHPNYENFEQTIEIDSAETSLDIVLVQAVSFTRVTIESTPSGADVFIDDIFVGITPLTIPLDMQNISGRTVIFRREGYQERSITMFEWQDTYRINLTPDPFFNHQDTPPPVIDDEND